MPDRDEIQRIAAAMNTLRPDWRISSLVTFLTEHHAARPYRDLLIAGVVVATDPKTKTPRLLNEHGAWWVAAHAATGTGGGTTVPTSRQPRCDIPGHEFELAPPYCRICRSEQIAAGAADTPPVPAVTERDADNAARIRAALREPDPRELAAGAAREDD